MNRRIFKIFTIPCRVIVTDYSMSYKWAIANSLALMAISMLLSPTPPLLAMVEAPRFTFFHTSRSKRHACFYEQCWKSMQLSLLLLRRYVSTTKSSTEETNGEVRGGGATFNRDTARLDRGKHMGRKGASRSPRIKANRSRSSL